MNKARIIFVTIGLVLFTSVLILVITGATQSMDLMVHDYFVSVHGSAADYIFIFFTYLGNVLTYVVVGAILLIYPKTRFSYGIPFAFTGCTSALVYEIIKYIVKRPRPDLNLALVSANGYSFPSGHSQNSFSILGILAILLIYYYRTGGASLPRYGNNPKPATLYIKKKAGAMVLCAVLSLLPVMIGVSRIYAGVHWISDVMAGWAMGLTLLTLFSGLFFTPGKVKTE